MPFNPTLPANNSAMVSAEMRAQFNGLKDLIDGLAVQVAAMQEQIDDLQFSLNAANNKFATLPNDPASMSAVTIAINDAHDDSAANVDGVTYAEVNINDPPTLDDVKNIHDKLRELVDALHR